ncbi:hypothetical protein M408DRAFT_14953 [Serendipita vermifera MAFF 305830]|uniref:CMP/dCMP-type deaminase domain-containing protein n=1 Tax=Serendipita vermifera MAFF 305830 TaxID=933852 RepID=A0A0C3B518_SERVB|nr:hypothetical protein M408DRAFT_14953 [Serendipita vermifera MAFF 305830]
MPETPIKETNSDETHLMYMHQALSEARKCTHVPTAFCVGCIIVVPVASDAVNGPTSVDNAIVLATGYSRELPGNTHAEANALHKARQLESLPPALAPFQNGTNQPPVAPSSISNLLAQASIYTTLEPCSIRTSGLAPCANAILEAGIRKCYIGAPEPLDFVTCEGAKILKEAGVEVNWVKGLEEECLSVARGEF